MYQILCDGHILYDHRDDDLVVLNPKCKLEVNTVGEGSFTILANHPNYDKLHRLKSIFEIRQDDDIIFRGRMTDDSRDFNNQIDVDMEGVLGFTNDTVIPPFDVFKDFKVKPDENIVEVFLRWILARHNEQAEPWQKLKVGRVTVSDPNNTIARSSTDYASTWDTLKSKLFESSLGGYLVIRYEKDGNYVDYLSGFEDTNPQMVTFGENLLDLTRETDTSQTYSAILPLGTDANEENESSVITLESLPDGDLTDDLVKKGKFIYSKSAVEQYGWICVPVSESKWDDVTVVENLKKKAMDYLTGTAMLLSSTITIKAVDLNFTDDQIQSFRIYRDILVNSAAHGLVNAKYQLTQLDIDILNPQNTTITVGDTVRTLIDINKQEQSSNIAKVETIASGVAGNVEQSVMNAVNQELVSYEEALTKTLEDYAKSAIGVVLFEDSAGADGFILLSDTVSNYSAIEVFFTDENGNGGGFLRVHNPNTKVVTLHLQEAGASVVSRQTAYTIADYEISPDITTASLVSVDSVGTISTAFGANCIKINRVVGFEGG